MKLYIFLLCSIAIPATFGDGPQNAMELDRARSSWNFGGHQPIKKSAYWNRPRNVAGPGSVLANRRMGTASTPMAPYRRKSSSPSGSSQKRRQQKPYPRSAQVGRPISKRNTNFPFPSPSVPAFPQSYPMSYYPNNQYHMTPASPWHRSSRKLRPTVDTLKSRFMKEDLWHLDKGESYVVKDEDLERDSMLRKRHYENNEIDSESHNAPNEETLHHHQLELDAENMINHGEHSNQTDNTKHIHHHHHYEMESKEKPTKPEASKPKPVDPTKVLAAPIPRIHNPIPLGCLLAVPVFHPVRPRHHLACLLSIPGTPSLTRRRRRRSADLPQLLPTSAQSESLLQQLFSNSGMTPIVTRKHYANHVGNGKNPPPSSQQGNYKIPATIIAPPHFDKDDVLSMLLGSGGISAEKMGTIVATNNRYVRYGRGLPNGQSTRQGRHINWMPETKVRNPSFKTLPQSSAPAPPMTSSSSNHIPKVVKMPPSAKKPMVQLTPYPKKSPYYQPHNSFFPVAKPNHAPLILNVQISPMQRVPNGPVIKIQPPQQQQQSQSEQSDHFHHEHEHVHHDHDYSHHEDQQPTKLEQPPKEQVTTSPEPEHKIEQSATIEQVQPTAAPEQLNVVTEEHHDYDHPTIAQEKLPAAPYQTVVVSSSGKAQKWDDFKYSDYWSPVDLIKSKPQKAYHYEYQIDSPEESKVAYKKVKPSSYSQTKSYSGYYENINDQIADSGISNVDSQSNYYYDNSYNVNHGSINSPSYLTASNWQDVYAKDEYDPHIDNVKSLNYAVKTNYKDELDHVLEKISSRERGTYSEVSYPEINDVYANIDTNQYSSNYNYGDSDSSAYSQEKYYTVKKAPAQLPEPIMISVPQEDEFSNELYDKKK